MALNLHIDIAVGDLWIGMLHNIDHHLLYRQTDNAIIFLSRRCHLFCRADVVDDLNCLSPNGLIMQSF